MTLTKPLISVTFIHYVYISTFISWFAPRDSSFPHTHILYPHRNLLSRSDCLIITQWSPWLNGVLNPGLQILKLPHHIGCFHDCALNDTFGLCAEHRYLLHCVQFYSARDMPRSQVQGLLISLGHIARASEEVSSGGRARFATCFASKCNHTRQSLELESEGNWQTSTCPFHFWAFFCGWRGIRAHRALWRQRPTRPVCSLLSSATFSSEMLSSVWAQRVSWAWKVN